MRAQRTDPFAGLLPFVATAESQSFRAAAKQLGVTPSSVSKAIAKLEADLGVRLLHRTSRTVSTTAEGELFLGRCRDALDQLLSAREVVSQAQRAPRGVLRVSLPPAFARALIMPALPQLLARHPLLAIEALLTDRFVRLAEEKVDVAVRVGKVTDASVVARKLWRIRLVTVAAPSYLARAGTPRSPAELQGHNCLAFVRPNGQHQIWSFSNGTAPITVTPAGNFVGDDGASLIEAASAGLGIVQAHDFMVRDHLARGELVEVLGEHVAPGPVIWVLSASGRGAGPKVRVFVDFVLELASRAAGRQAPR